jgi:hypothetical protein
MFVKLDLLVAIYTEKVSQELAITKSLFEPTLQGKHLSQVSKLAHYFSPRCIHFFIVPQKEDKTFHEAT